MAAQAKIQEKNELVNVKPLDIAAKKWSSRASGAQQEYEDGTQGADWKGPAASETAETNYATGVQQAVSRKARQAGIGTVSNEDWKTSIREKGKANYGTGVLAESSKAKWQKKFTPYGNALKGLTLTARGARGAATNYERSKAVGTKLHDTKTGAAK